MSGVDDLTAEPASPPTLLDRLRAAGVSDERIQAHLAAGTIRLDGETMTDLDQPAPEGTRPLIGPP
jgi:hypothetical protein